MLRCENYVTCVFRFDIKYKCWVVILNTTLFHRAFKIKETTKDCIYVLSLISYEIPDRRLKLYMRVEQSAYICICGTKKGFAVN